MTTGKWLVIVGGIFLFAGLVSKIAGLVDNTAATQEARTQGFRDLRQRLEALEQRGPARP